MNTFMNGLQNATNYTLTENGALAHKSTLSAVYDMFAMGGAMRGRSDEDVILMFKNAYEEDKELTLKCLFYLRDCRGGQGERRFFRLAYNWLCKFDSKVAAKLVPLVSEYGRWDDLIYTTINTPVFKDVVSLIKDQLYLDGSCKTPSLLAKWIPSENASSVKTKKAASALRAALNLSHKEYRKMLSVLRKKINIVERLMSENRWDEIEFDKIPSKAGLIYKNAFARRDIIKQKYENFAMSSDTKVNAKTLYPYEIVEKVVKAYDLSDVDRAMINKYWDNLPDYLEGKPSKMLCMIDTSGSMTCMNNRPISVAISLGLYCAEHMSGPFANYYMSFASIPQLIKTEGIDFVDKVNRIFRTNLCDNTNLLAAFDLIKKIAKKSNPEDIPETLTVISDMQIDMGTRCWRNWGNASYFTPEKIKTEMERMRDEWTAEGLKLPKLVYWNVNATNPTILDDGPDVSYVSGCSPVIFKMILTGKTGIDLMFETLNADRYAAIKL